ncbi:MAG TPA: asparagine synthase (glutamine-hydrolyzing) [Saprospiraceae bacterium]|nr:asparagine synthase (glutamine-hydrolyzing) [Saprospiraceae bacterium]
MCGIAGIVDKNHLVEKREIVIKMMDKMIHRGPDSSGYWSEGYVAFGHRRLSIIDLTPGGHQPKTDSIHQNTITFNGEIYNYKKLKSELTDYSFVTNSDTEVILAAYAKWGFDCVKYLKGQFAFAIWDETKKLLFIARDHLGEKPFYYYHANGIFLFGSEVRALLASNLIEKKISKDAIVDYLKYQSVNAPNTIVNEIFALPAASYGILKENSLNIHSYWTHEDLKELPENTEYKVVLDNIRFLFSESVKGQMQSDVPLGAFLSGGIDSSAIVAMMAEHATSPIHTFNVSFEDKQFDESIYANLIAKKYKTDHTQIDLKPTVLLEQLPEILSSMDVPSGDGPNTYIISQAVKNRGLTVALSGLGGDDLFVGYVGFLRYMNVQKYKAFWDFPNGIRKALSSTMGLIKNDHSTSKKRALLELEDVSLSSFYGLSRSVFSPSEIHYLAPKLNATTDFLRDNMNQWLPEVDHLPEFSRYGLAELNGYTQNVLLKDSDVMAMANSLEIRSPFFDHELVSYVLSIGDAIKYPHTPKKLLVDAIQPMLPDEIVHRKKMGFSFPWDSWVRKELQPFVDQSIKDLANRNIFDKANLLKYYQDYCDGSPLIIWSKIWLLVNLEAWISKNIE